VYEHINDLARQWWLQRSVCSELRASGGLFSKWSEFSGKRSHLRVRSSLLSLFCATRVAVCFGFWSGGLGTDLDSRWTNPNSLLIVCADSPWACHWSKKVAQVELWRFKYWRSARRGHWSDPLVSGFVKSPLDWSLLAIINNMWSKCGPRMKEMR